MAIVTGPTPPVPGGIGCFFENGSCYNTGRSGVWLEDGGSIMDTESSLDVEELIRKYIFEKNDN